jgi:GntR family galactonate operon transcriptional repressor
MERLLSVRPLPNIRTRASMVYWHRDPLHSSKHRHGQVAHEIGRQIVSGKIHEGEFLPKEVELSAEFGVGRQAVREAIKVLAAKGLVSSRRRAGTSVTPKSAWNLLDPDVLAWHAPVEDNWDFLTDLVELRRLLEPAAAALAASRGDTRRVGRIGEALNEMRRSADDVEKFLAADARFHVAVFAACGNTVIERLSAIIGPVLEASFRLVGGTNPVFGYSIGQHEAVFDAIRTGDPGRARAAMETIMTVASKELAQLENANKSIPAP